MNPDELDYALKSALRFAASRSTITSAQEKALLAVWNTRATEPAQAGDADRAFELWFFRDTVDDQRSKLIALMLGGAVAKEATNHGTQRLCLKHILKALRAQGRAEAEREIVALREQAGREAAMLREIAKSEARGLDWQVNLTAAADFLRTLYHRKEGA